MARVAEGIQETARILDVAPVVVGGIAVLCRLTTPHRATDDVDVVDRLLDGSQLEILRAAPHSEEMVPAGVVLKTTRGSVRVDVLEVRQAELDHPSEDAGDRLHAAAHAWAFETATPVVLTVHTTDSTLHVATPMAECGPLVAMKLQALMDRTGAKQGTDLLDIVRLTVDRGAQAETLAQLAAVEGTIAADVRLHIEHWLIKQRHQSLRSIRSTGAIDIELDDLDLVAELLMEAIDRR